MRSSRDVKDVILFLGERRLLTYSEVDFLPVDPTYTPTGSN